MWGFSAIARHGVVVVVELFGNNNKNKVECGGSKSLAAVFNPITAFWDVLRFVGRVVVLCLVDATIMAFRLLMTSGQFESPTMQHTLKTLLITNRPQSRLAIGARLGRKRLSAGSAERRRSRGFWMGKKWRWRDGGFGGSRR